MGNRLEGKEDWIAEMVARANAVQHPADLKNRVMEQIALKNESGKLLAAVRIDSFQDHDPIDAVIRELKPGMGKAIYFAGPMEEMFSQQTNYEAVTWEFGLEALRERAYPWTIYMPADTKLKRIEVYYGFDNATNEEIDEMKDESRRTGNRVIVRDLRPNDRLVGLRLQLAQDDFAFELRVFGTTKSRIHVPDMAAHTVESLKVRGHEAIFSANADKQQLIWAEETAEGMPVQYELSAEQADRNRLVSLAETLA
jgi:hypothetical protein